MKKAMNYKDVLLELGFKISQESSDYYRMRPIYRDSDNDSALIVYKNNGWCIDNPENEQFPFSVLVAKTMGASVKDAKKWLISKDRSYEVCAAHSQKDRIELPEKHSITELGHTTRSFKFYLDKGISEKTLDDFGCVFCHSGKMSNRLTFVIRDPRGIIRGFSGRDALNYKDSTRPKWKHLGKSKFFCYPGYITSPFITQTKQLILVESIGDALAAYDAGYKQILVLFGLNLSKELLCYIMTLNPEKIYLCLNNDKDKKNNRGQAAAEKVMNKLLKVFPKDDVINIVPPKNDLGDMNKEEIQKFMQQNGIKKSHQ